MAPCFTYGDIIRKTAGGPLRTVKDVGPDYYDFTDGTFALIADQDCYTLVEKASGFFLVATSLADVPLNGHLHHDYGYEERSEFAAALRRLIHYWGGRVGERCDERNKFLRLQFHDTPGGLPDKAWLPLLLLTPTAIPDYLQEEPQDETEKELDRIFGFPLTTD